LKTHFAGIIPEPTLPDWWIILSKRTVKLKEEVARLSALMGSFLVSHLSSFSYIDVEDEVGTPF
jgi:hypothetical protein